jgi:hypothetical protein
MKGNAAVQATQSARATQSSRVKPRPVMEKASELLQLRSILVDPDAPANRAHAAGSAIGCRLPYIRLRHSHSTGP